MTVEKRTLRGQPARVRFLGLRRCFHLDINSNRIVVEVCIANPRRASNGSPVWQDGSPHHLIISDATIKKEVTNPPVAWGFKFGDLAYTAVAVWQSSAAVTCSQPRTGAVRGTTYCPGCDFGNCRNVSSTTSSKRPPCGSLAFFQRHCRYQDRGRSRPQLPSGDDPWGS